MRIRRVVEAAVILFAATAVACAQTGPSDYYSAEKLHAVGQDLTAKAQSAHGGLSGVVLQHYPAEPAAGKTSPGQSINVNVRTANGGGEIHQRFADIFIVLDGEATMLTGGTIPDVKIDAATGEGRGERVVGGATQKIAKGDVFHIPAGTPHQTLVEKGKSFTYICVKVGKEAVAAGAAPATASVDYFSAAKLQSVGADTLASANSAASGAGNTTLVRYAEHFINITARTKSATSAELHGHYSDLFFVLSGEMIEVTGGTTASLKTDATTGEGHGALIEGGTRQVLHAGDMLHINPNTPHESLMEPGKEFTAIVVKLHQE